MDSVTLSVFFVVKRSFYYGIGISSFSVGKMLGSPIFGFVGDRFGRVQTLTLTLVGSALVISTSFLPDATFSTLATSRFFSGCFACYAFVFFVLNCEVWMKLGHALLSEALL